MDDETPTDFWRVIGRLEERVDGIAADVRAIDAKMDQRHAADVKRREKRGEEEREIRRQGRRDLLGVAVAIIGAVGVIVAAIVTGGHP